VSTPAIIRAARPHQWVKNVLVVAGPLAGGWPDGWTTTVSVIIAFVAFCLTSSAVYLVNDVIDIDADRAHPVKRFRPIAAGEVNPTVAVGVASMLIIAGLGTAVATGRWQLAVVLAIYAVIQLAYCLWLKNVAVIDLAVVASGFLLRAIAGGAAAGIFLSQWFLLVASFGSLFMVAGKRYSEVHLVGEGAAATRRILQEYSASYLRFTWGLAGSVTVTFYSLWAFDIGARQPLLAQLSIAPFVLALLRYAVDIDRGAAGEPEAIVIGDRVLQVLGVVWLGLFAVSAMWP
jgi:decaprenyl-phosphate phosphoribosyltransferase